MRDDVKQQIWQGFSQLRGVLRRPEIMAFLPAVTLAAFWLGGEEVLIVTALGLPLLFAFVGAFRFHTDKRGLPDGVAGFFKRIDKPIETFSSFDDNTVITSFNPRNTTNRSSVRS